MNQLDREPLEEVPRALVLVPPSRGGHHGAEPGDDSGCIRVPPTHGLDREGHKCDSLVSTGIKVEPVLLVESDHECVQGWWQIWRQC